MKLIWISLTHTIVKKYLKFQVGEEIYDLKLIGTFVEPWFCGKDICRILGLNDMKQALQENIEPEYKRHLL